jgi:hypothetical protein
VSNPRFSAHLFLLSLLALLNLSSVISNALGKGVSHSPWAMCWASERVVAGIRDMPCPFSVSRVTGCSSA